MKLSLFLLCAAAAIQAQTAANPGNVTLPLDEYNHLIDLASRPSATPANAPMPYAIQSAAIKVDVKAQTATASIDLEGEILARGAVKMPMIRGMIVVDAQRAGAPLPVEQEGGAQYAILEGPGSFSITLNAIFPIAIDAGRAGFQLPAPEAGAVRFSLAVPGDRTNVTLTPGLITSHANDGKNTLVEATLQPGQLTFVSWTTHDAGAAPTAQPPKEARFLSDVKTMVTVGESQISLAALADLTVIQGDPGAFEFDIPVGYEFTGATGATLASTEAKPGVVTLKVADAKARSHQFLLTFERAVDDSKADIAIPAFHASQRETGEAAVEGEGALELTAKETGSLKRMDLKEASPFLIGLSHRPVQSAFRYHGQAGEAAGIHLEWQRFANSPVTAAISDQAMATTLVTADGHTLTEVKLTVRNHAQPFLKVGLPAGATIQTAEVGGQPVKPVVAADGNRIPLLRAGFHPTGAYEVSFVFLSSGAPFARKGGSELELPKMDLPVAVIHWEVFLPDRYKVKDFAGDVVTDTYPPVSSPRTLYTLADNTAGKTLLDDNDLGVGIRDTGADALVLNGSSAAGLGSGPGGFGPSAPGQLAGRVIDPAGAAVANAHIIVTNSTNGQVLQTNSNQFGSWKIGGVSSGRVTIKVERPGFKSYFANLSYDQSSPRTVNATLQVGATAETVEVHAEAASKTPFDKKEKDLRDDQASANVVNLQQRVAGVLPIRIDVPRAGHSFRFIRPLVVDEATKVTFTYKSQ